MLLGSEIYKLQLLSYLMASKRILSVLTGFLFGIILLSLISAASPTLGTVRQDNCINLMQTCPDCSYNNISSVLYPNSSIAMGNAGMTKLGTQYTFNWCNTSVIGTYFVNGFGDPAGTKAIWVYTFEVTATGNVLDMPKTNLYIFTFIFCFVVFIGLLIAGSMIDGNDRTDQMTGYIIAVSNMKYVKMICFAVAYIFLIFICYFSWMISHAFLQFNFVSSIMQWIFYVLAACAFPFFVLFVYLTIANLIHDTKVKDALLYGIAMKG